MLSCTSLLRFLGTRKYKLTSRMRQQLRQTLACSVDAYSDAWMAGQFLTLKKVLMLKVDMCTVPRAAGVHTDV